MHPPPTRPIRSPGDPAASAPTSSTVDAGADAMAAPSAEHPNVLDPNWPSPRKLSGRSPRSLNGVDVECREVTSDTQRTGRRSATPHRLRCRCRSASVRRHSCARPRPCSASWRQHGQVDHRRCSSAVTPPVRSKPAAIRTALSSRCTAKCRELRSRACGSSEVAELGRQHRDRDRAPERRQALAVLPVTTMLRTTCRVDTVRHRPPSMSTMSAPRHGGRRVSGRLHMWLDKLARDGASTQHRLERSVDGSSRCSTGRSLT